MKQLVLVLLFLQFGLKVFGQNDSIQYWRVNKEDPFNDVHCPIPDGFSMWLMRQNMMVSGFQTIVEYNNIHNNDLNTNSPEYRVETYMPVFQTSKVNAVLGARYWKSALMEDDFYKDNTVQFVWLYTILQYKPNEKWNLVLSTESYQKGNQYSFYKDEGNLFFANLYAGYSLNTNWQLIGFFGYNQLWKPDNIERSPIMGVQLKWLPNKKLKLMTGLPILFATEWSTSKKLDLAAYVWYNMQVNSFARYRVTKKTSLSLVFKNSDFKSKNLYFDTQTAEYNNQVFSYNNLTQMQHRLTLEMGLKGTKNTSVQLSFGHLFGSNNQFNLNNDNQIKSRTSNGWIGGISFYFLNL